MTDYSTMKRYKCSKCGMLGISKGPGRSMHLQGLADREGPKLAGLNWETLLPSMMFAKAEDDAYRPGEKDLVLRVSMHSRDEERNTIEGALRHLHKVMHETTEDQFVAAFCQHKMELDPADQVE